MKICIESTGQVFSHSDVQVRLWTGQTSVKVPVQAYVVRTDALERRYFAAFPKRLSLELVSESVLVRIGHILVRRWVEPGTKDPVYLSALAVEARDPNELSDFECELIETLPPVLVDTSFNAWVDVDL